MMKRLLSFLALCLVLVGGGADAQVQPGPRLIPVGFCSMSGMSAATSITVSTCVRATFTGTGSGSNLNVSAITGLLWPGDSVAGTGVPAGTTIVSQTSGTKQGAGVYVTSNPTTSSGAGLTSGGVPVGASYMVGAPVTQGVVWRDDAAPTGTPGVGGQGVAAGSQMQYAGNLSSLQFIQQASGAVLGLSFYRVTQ
jgi:hypothetical protein